MAENFRMYYERKGKERIAKLRYESTRDELTGLLNYRAFDRGMKKLAAKDDEEPTYLAIFKN